MGEFIAFQAAVELLKDNNNISKLDTIHTQIHEAEKANTLHTANFVKQVYEDFSPEQINAKIATMLRAEDINAEVEIIYQSIEGLRMACPNHTGDWYFTGNYPTPGGNSVVNRAFANYMLGKVGRGY
jgi:amidophosphoribosyltransferase